MCPVHSSPRAKFVKYPKTALSRAVSSVFVSQSGGTWGAMVVHASTLMDTADGIIAAKSPKKELLKSASPSRKRSASAAKKSKVDEKASDPVNLNDFSVHIRPRKATISSTCGGGKEDRILDLWMAKGSISKVSECHHIETRTRHQRQRVVKGHF